MVQARTPTPLDATAACGCTVASRCACGMPAGQAPVAFASSLSTAGAGREPAPLGLWSPPDTAAPAPPGGSGISTLADPDVVPDLDFDSCCNIGDFCITGDAVGQLADIDAKVEALMRNCNVPNLSMAIVSGDGRLVLARGYTYCGAFPATSSVFIAQPTSRYRVASISKTFTATAIMHLYEAGKLSLLDTVGDLIPGDLAPYSNPELEDAQVFTILCHMSSLGNGQVNWGRNFELENKWIADELGVSLPIDDVDVLHFAASWVSFETPDGTDDPGCEPVYKYTNFGYMVLGRIIRAASLDSYDQYLKKHIFAKLGMDDMDLARPRKTSGRAYDEVEYFYTDGPDLEYSETPVLECIAGFDNGLSYGRSVIDDSGECLEIPYGGYVNIDNFVAAGGWIGHVIDLCRWGWELHDPETVSIISKESLELMSVDWTQYGCADGGEPYGLGWYLNLIRDGDRGHGGGMPGTKSMLYLFPVNDPSEAAGAVVALVMNRNPEEAKSLAFSKFSDWLLGSGGKNSDGKLARMSAEDWGTDDLWAKYEQTWGDVLAAFEQKIDQGNFLAQQLESRATERNPEVAPPFEYDWMWAFE